MVADSVCDTDSHVVEFPILKLALWYVFFQQFSYLLVYVGYEQS